MARKKSLSELKEELKKREDELSLKIGRYFVQKKGIESFSVFKSYMKDYDSFLKEKEEIDEEKEINGLSDELKQLEEETVYLEEDKQVKKVF